ncbi:hypothetical protein G7B40_000535 [Aetokthonos hydrillicola Thurmond2011]|jgi:hypothetical protein|uniref:Uncharacterized protein n=1 Tax=Aetokthonos hydrillicola Thurmond2011 TaxID=2712845 RepID=A0AAP5M808_9CYAN|nr:hypothetical protein [Aetokthonos hydrillicola]MBO3460472.1 hypothetical protein [Aetokthonos hydrillicola CCALA 1050]MBW4588240.1 hypothetical protein [Aetokthonos hydrillicola CCALA 1050]MDR9893073.1 hypothetical protein [Aetokthonos hydrillicola Thurmond2011]
MKLLNYLLVILIIALNFLFARPSLADAPKITKSPYYIEVTKSLKALQNQLSAAESGKTLTESIPVQDIQKKIDELSFQKYALERGFNWGQCRNETGKTIAIYGPKPEKPKSEFDNALYFLSSGETTPRGWDCQGIYLAKDSKIAGLSTNAEDITGAAAIKIPKGTQLIAKSNSETGTLELNITPKKVFKAGDINWYIPNVSETNIAARIPDVLVNSEEEAD